jgi:hypothetical protein
MTTEDHKFLHDLTNKLAKIDGFTGMLKSEINEDNDRILKIEKATQEAIDLVQDYRALLEAIESRRKTGGL